MKIRIRVIYALIRQVDAIKYHMLRVEYQFVHCDTTKLLDKRCKVCIA